MHVRFEWVGFVVCALAPSVGHADVADWAEGTGDDGATRDYANRAAEVAWENPMGDFLDADGVAQGDAPFASAPVSSTVELDVTDLVARWASGELPADGFFLRGGSARFHSREAGDASLRPSLSIDTGSEMRVLAAEADTHLDASTYRGFGSEPELVLGPALVRFPREQIVGATVARATLTLHASDSGGEVLVFACRQRRVIHPVEHGFAADLDRDAGIADHADVIDFVDFSGDDWTRDDPRWPARGGVVIDGTSAADVENGFEELDGPAARWGFASGDNGGGGATFAFAAGDEPMELYSRYYLRFGRNFTPTVDGGKMPGFSFRSSSADVTCNGGNPDPSGLICWSARGSFSVIPPPGNPLAGYVHLGWYFYHPDQEGTYGDAWHWNDGYDAHLAPARWYSVEEYVRVNSVSGSTGAHDGVLRAWVNGRLVYEKTDILFTNSDAIRVGQVWYDIYHGGAAPAPHDMYFWVDNLVVARSYVGPMGGVPDAPPLLESGMIVERPDGGPVDLDGGATMPRRDGGTDPMRDVDGGGPATEDTAGCGCSASRASPIGALLVAVLVATRRKRSPLR